jgi:hypothetical protein
MDNSNKEIIAFSETSLSYLTDISKWTLIIGGINLLTSTVIFYFAVYIVFGSSIFLGLLVFFLGGIQIISFRGLVMFKTKVKSAIDKRCADELDKSLGGLKTYFRVLLFNCIMLLMVLFFLGIASLG